MTFLNFLTNFEILLKLKSYKYGNKWTKFKNITGFRMLTAALEKNFSDVHFFMESAMIL